ncbi:MAG: hypothetical protein RIS70_1638 [Planctomycetota bacterium]|jgi:hypothetical protein
MNLLLAFAVLMSGETQVPDGTLLFLERGNLVVELWTGKDITHVGMIFREGGEPWLYEAVPGKVRRIRLDAYYREISEYNRGRRDPARVWLCQPSKSYSPQACTDMRSFLQSQIDRRYSIKNYVKGRNGDGIHCAELTAETLNQSGRFQFSNSFAISPGELAESIRPHYEGAIGVQLAPPLERSWCERSTDWWLGFVHWCGWSCNEALSFCR